MENLETERFSRCRTISSLIQTKYTILLFKHTTFGVVLHVVYLTTQCTALCIKNNRKKGKCQSPFIYVTLPHFLFYPLWQLCLWVEHYQVLSFDILDRSVSTVFYLIACLTVIVSFCLFNIYYPNKTTSPLVEYSLHVIIERLTIFQAYLRQQTIKDIKDQNSSINYDLSKYEHECPHHQYVTRIIERKPLIIYIENFLTRNEIEHLARLAYV